MLNLPWLTTNLSYFNFAHALKILLSYLFIIFCKYNMTKLDIAL